MAVINNTITMTDNVSPALRNMNRAIQGSISLMEKLNRISNNMGMAKSFEDTTSKINAADISIKAFTNSLQKAINIASELNRVLDRDSSNVEKDFSNKSGIAKLSQASTKPMFSLPAPKAPPLLSLPAPKGAVGSALPQVIEAEWSVVPLSKEPKLPVGPEIIEAEWSVVPSSKEPKLPVGPEIIEAEWSAVPERKEASAIAPQPLKQINIKSLIDMSKQMINMGIGAANYLDTISMARARIDSINDGTQTTVELQDKIFAASNNSRMSYAAMQDSVVNLSSLTNGVFKSNDESIAFAETLGKMFAISGASAENAKGTMDQLTQAMAAGKLQGGELNSIMENAPMLAEAIATEMGRPKEELQSLAAEGAITANIVKSAMFGASDEVNTKLQDVPMTFGQKMQEMSNSISINLIKILEPIAAKFSEWLNSESAEKFFNALSIGIGIVGAILGGFISIVEGVISILDTLKPILVVIGILILTYFLTPFIVTAMAFLSVLPLMAAELLKNAIKMAADWFIAYWPIILIVGGILLLIYILMQLGVTFDQIVGFIVGLLYSLAAIVYNIVIDIINPFIIFATFLSNLFIDPVGAIKMLFLDMASFIIDKIAWVAGALEDLVNLIPWIKVDMTSGLDDMSTMIKAAKEKVKEESGVKEAKTLEHKDIGAEALKGYNKGSDFIKGLGSGSKEGGLFGSLKDKFNLEDSNKFGDLTNSGILESGQSLGSGGSAFSNPSDIGNVGSVGEVGKINEDVSITEEDIKLLRDIAEAKFINSYTTLRPEMKVEFTGPINETADVNKILSAIEDMAAEAMANTIIEEAI